MSLIERTKAALQKKLEEDEDASSDEEIPKIDEYFDFYDKKWVLAPHMDEISNGELPLIPIECVLTHYILRYGSHCLYIALDNHETGDDFEVYEFDWVGDIVHGDEKLEPEFKTVEASLNSVEAAKFLSDRIQEGYLIYIEERKELDIEI